jgi:signal transduction histidine kinase
MLDKIGLRHSIQNLCDQLMTNRELFVTADISYDRQLRQESELQLYRIIQEALTNVIKYADALAAKVTILAEGHTVDVTIQDNGKGFNVEETLGSREAFGLHSIIARTKALQGSFSIVSGSTGTVIHILIPVQDGNDRHSR